MDFVLLGFGMGALLILAGRAVRTYGPRYRRRQLDHDAPFSIFSAGLAWRRACRGAGLIAALAGALLCVLTLFLLLAGFSDRSGMVVVLFILLALAIGAGIWAVLFVRPEWRSATRPPAVAHVRRDTAASTKRNSAVATWPDRSTSAQSSGNGPRPSTEPVDAPARESAGVATWPRRPVKEQERSSETVPSNAR